jgi:DNA-binding response OmpR family regulator
MYTILIVDDEANLRLLYEKELNREGYAVKVAASGKDALEQMAVTQPDLVVLDIKMPGMDGLELMNKILAVNNRLPVIISSAYASYKDNFATWSADAYVVKSSDLSELKETIRTILQQRYGDKR